MQENLSYAFEVSNHYKPIILIQTHGYDPMSEFIELT